MMFMLMTFCLKSWFWCCLYHLSLNGYVGAHGAVPDAHAHVSLSAPDDHVCIVAGAYKPGHEHVSQLERISTAAYDGGERRH